MKGSLNSGSFLSLWIKAEDLWLLLDQKSISVDLSFVCPLISSAVLI